MLSATKKGAAAESAPAATAATELAVASIDPTTGRPWAPLQYTEGASRYLLVRWGIEVLPHTMTRWRCNGTGPKWRYASQRPIITLTELDRFAAEELLTDSSPLWRKERPTPKRPPLRKRA